MRIVNTYSFKKGEDFIKGEHSSELQEVVNAIRKLDATICLTKESKEKTKKGWLLFSPPAMNKELKTCLLETGWTKAAVGKRKPYVEPRHNFGEGRFREMDGIKNRVGLEIQFGKYAFMGYDIFSKMIIFKNLNYIECGIEVVPSKELVKEMSSGVSSFEQLMVDFKYRKESNIDIPVYVLAIGLTEGESVRCRELSDMFKNNKKEALSIIKMRKYRGSRPGPK